MPRYVIAAAIVLVCVTWTLPANAIPAFASQTDRNCSYCHQAWPQLNEKGREFKELGYRFSEQVGLERSEFIDAPHMPVSVVIRARPYDKKDSGDFKLRALQEFELFIAGPISRDLSGFMEIEYEDEIDDSFGQEIVQPTLTYHVNRGFNVQLGYGEMFRADPYGFIGDPKRLTRGRVGVIDKNFGGADADIRASRQTVNVYGRTGGLFYNVGLAGEAKDAEGVDAETVFGRVAYEITPNVMVGALSIEGRGSMVDYSRFGVDFQADIGETRLQGAYISGDDDVLGGGDVENDALSLSAFHTFKTKEGKPTFVPLIRYDTYEANDGMDDFGELTLNLTYYFTENVKAYVEYWDQVDTPSGVSGDSRVTLQIFVGF